MLVAIQYCVTSRRQGRWHVFDDVRVEGSLREAIDAVAGMVACALERAGKDDFQNGEGSTYLHVHLLPVRDAVQLREGVQRGLSTIVSTLDDCGMTPGEAEATIDAALREEVDNEEGS
jgi:hypothetical protein